DPPAFPTRRSSDLRPTRTLDEPGHVLGVLFFLGQIGQGDVSAFAGEGDRHGSADARVRTGDQRPAPLETTGAAIAVLTAIRVRDEFGVQARFGLVLFRWCDVGESIDRVLESQLVTHLSPSSCSVGVLLDVRGGCRPRAPRRPHPGGHDTTERSRATTGGYAIGRRL